MMIRYVAVTFLLVDAVLYAKTMGWKPAVVWLGAAIITAKFLPEEQWFR